MAPFQSHPTFVRATSHLGSQSDSPSQQAEGLLTAKRNVQRPRTRQVRFLTVLGIMLGGLLLSACAIPPLEQLQSNLTQADAGAETRAVNPPPDTFGGLVTSIDNYAVPTPVPTAEPDTTVVVNTVGARANIRSGPGLDFPIVGKGNPGAAFAVVSSSADQEWWQICCFQGTDDAEGEATTQGWVSASVVRLAGDAEAVAVNVTEEVLRPDLESNWEVDWQCGSERCDVKSCSAAVQAQVSGTPQQPLLSIEHEVTWDDTCFATDSWVFDVNQFTGQERTGEYGENFLYGYWLGANPGEANGAYTMPDGQVVAVWCSGPHTVEIEEGSGWTTVYEGNTCHDVRTGMLVLLSYNKRWLFTGEFEGQSYDRAYFGDNETLRQRLTDTNVTLQFVEER
ncbi:MAG: SH3 domain-containing protein [Caldilineaceae bacterium]|nr:SH3 domain-containing protein [Caldilineaceae bacterium]